MKIRAALAHESELLSALAMRAKAYWGYSEEMLEKWRGELTLEPGDISSHPTFVATIEEEAAGFYCLSRSDNSWKLNHFWVSPQHMDQGIGRALIAHALNTAASYGASSVTLDADPNAEAFYVKCGASRLGEVAAPIPGQPKRVRPQLVFYARAI
jgi:molybdenum cofactor cytidylyltransferase